MTHGMGNEWRVAVGTFITVALWATPDGATAGGRERQRVATSAGLTVTGFAVPVGIPVAGAPLPLVVYSYRGVAGETSANADGRAGCGCTGCGCGEVNGRNPGAGSAARVTTQEAPPPAEPDGAIVLREKCARCHSGEAAEGEVDLWESATGPWRPGWRQSGGAIYRAVRDGRMPKGGPTLSDEEFAAVVDFLLSDDVAGEAESGSAAAE